MDGISNDFDSASAETINRGKLAFGPVTNPANRDDQGPGIEYVCQIAQIRTMITRDGDRGFYIDLRVVEAGEGGSPAGSEASYEWYPEKKAQYKAKHEGRLKRNVGACYGYDATASTAQVTGAVIAATFVDYGHTDSKINQGVSSPLRGRLVRVRSRAVHSNKHGSVSRLELKPYLVDGKPVDRAIGAIVTPAPAALPVATPVVAAVTPQPFPPAGWAPHPDASHAAQGWYYEVATGQPKHERDLRKTA